MSQPAGNEWYRRTAASIWHMSFPGLGKMQQLAVMKSNLYIVCTKCSFWPKRDVHLALWRLVALAFTMCIYTLLLLRAAYTLRKSCQCSRTSWLRFRNYFGRDFRMKQTFRIAIFASGLWMESLGRKQPGHYIPQRTIAAVPLRSNVVYKTTLLCNCRDDV